jgi:TonB family protein
MKSMVRILMVAVILSLTATTVFAVRIPRDYVHLKKSPQPVKGWTHMCKCFSYPESARMDRVSGTVIISALVLPDGSVSKTRIEEGVRADLNMAAQCCMSKVLWVPGENEDGPVAAWVEIPITYTLSSEASNTGNDTAPAQAGIVIKAPRGL